MNYQGRLSDTSDVNKADGPYDMVFKIYTVAGGGTAAWTESWTNAALWTETAATTVTNGTGGNGCSTDAKKIVYTTQTNESSLKAGQYLWNTTIKESAVTSIITVPELTMTAGRIVSTTFSYVLPYALLVLSYWLLTSSVAAVASALERRMTLHLRG